MQGAWSGRGKPLATAAMVYRWSLLLHKTRRARGARRRRGSPPSSPVVSWTPRQKGESRVNDQHRGSEFVWQGRLHLGDVPGTYGDAVYAGLCAELPVTLKANPSSTSSHTAEFLLDAEAVEIHGDYPGHMVSIISYEPSPDRSRWKETVLTECRMRENRARVFVDLAKLPDTIPLSVRVRVDTTVPAGLYDDFVLVRLSLESEKYYASLGFEYQSTAE